MMTITQFKKAIKGREVYAFVFINQDTEILVHMKKSEVLFQMAKLPPDTVIRAFINSYNQVILG